jgi:hypothetical protein
MFPLINLIISLVTTNLYITPRLNESPISIECPNTSHKFKSRFFEPLYINSLFMQRRFWNCQVISSLYCLTIYPKVIGLLDVNLVKLTTLKIITFFNTYKSDSTVIYSIGTDLIVVFFFFGSTYLSKFNILILCSYIISKHFNSTYNSPIL